MHDLGFFRANFDKVSERLSTRGNIAGLDQFRELAPPSPRRKN
jgi:hypothetical protein